MTNNGNICEIILLVVWLSNMFKIDKIVFHFFSFDLRISMLHDTFEQSAIPKIYFKSVEIFVKDIIIKNRFFSVQGPLSTKDHNTKNSKFLRVYTQG